MVSQIAKLKPYRERLRIIIKGEIQNKNISKRSILIYKINEIYENIPYKHIEIIVESFITRLQKCIELEDDKAGY